MRKIRLLLAALLLLFGGVVWSPLARAAEEKLRVLVLLPLTGDAAAFGNSMKNGMMLGVEKLSPKATDSIEMIFQDDRMIPRETVTVFNRVHALSPVDVVVAFSSSTSNAIAPIAESKKVTTFGIASDGAVSRDRKYAFNFWVTPEGVAKKVVDELSRRNHKGLARIGLEHDGVLATDRAFDAISGGRFDLVLDEHFPIDNKDFRSFINKLRAKQAEIDATIISLFPGQLSVFGRQLKEAGIKTDLCSFELIEDLNEIKQANGAFDGVWFSNAADPDGEFTKLYQQRFPNTNSIMSANGHDIVLMLGKAVDEGVKREDLHNFFSKIKNFKGALGTFSSTGDQKFTLPAELKIIRNNGFESLKR
jgi:branched-chain amino acid transport system substrate-binding protein